MCQPCIRLRRFDARCCRQYIKMGVFSGGSNLEAVGAEEGKKEVLECKLGAAVPGDGTP